MAHHLVGMSEIAEMLGVTRQRVSQIVASYQDFPAPEVELSGGRVWSRAAVETWIAAHPDRGKHEQPSGLFARFTDLARGVVGQAQQEARRLDHNYIGTEHLLIGLIAIDDGLARTALRMAGVNADDLRDRVEAKVGRGAGPTQGHIPFTKRAKETLDRALDEAVALGGTAVGTEHILIAILGDTKAVACEVLSDITDLVRLHVSIKGMAASFGSTQPAAEEGALTCSFCGKLQSAVAKLIAGPNVFICDECIGLCNDILDAERPDEPEPDDLLTSVLARLVKLEERVDALGSD